MFGGVAGGVCCVGVVGAAATTTSCLSFFPQSNE